MKSAKVVKYIQMTDGSLLKLEVWGWVWYQERLEYFPWLRMPDGMNDLWWYILYIYFALVSTLVII